MAKSAFTGRELAQLGSGAGSYREIQALITETGAEILSRVTGNLVVIER